MWKILGRARNLILLTLTLTLVATPGWATGAGWLQEHDDEVHKRRFVFRSGDGGYTWFGDMGNGFLGIELTELTAELRRHFGVPEESGVMVGKVLADSPADRAGIEVGDILAAVDGKPVDSAHDVVRLIRKKEEGQTADLEVWRKGKPQTLSVEVAERERRVFDVGEHVIQIAPGVRALRMPKVEDAEIHVESMGGVAKALEHLQKLFNSPEWHERLKHMENMDWQRVEDRMKSVEKRLKELEEELEKAGEGKNKSH